MHYSNLSNKELLELQKKYRSGLIKEKDIPKNQLKDLKELYKKQIKIINDSIEEDKRKIIEIRKKLKK